MKYLFFLVSFSFNLFSQDLDWLISDFGPISEIQVNKDNHNLTSRRIRGIKIVSDTSKVDDVSFRGVDIGDLNVPCPKEFKKLLSCFLGKPLSKALLVEIKQEILCYYQNCSRPFVKVIIPKQNITQRSLQIVVLESKLGEIRAVGNCHFSDKCLISQVCLQPKGPINLSCLVKDLDWINKNPFRQVDAVFVPSIDPEYTDIELRTCDQAPWRVFGGVENTGLDLTGHNRWFFGFNYGNLFNRGHLFSYQFTLGSEYSDYWAHSFSYTAPLPNRDTLTLYGGLSEVQAIQVNDNKNALLNIDSADPSTIIKTHGLSVQASLRYEMPVYCIKDLLQEFVFGYDFKHTDTSLTLDSIPFIGRSVNLTQFMLGYNMGLDGCYGKHALTFEFFFSPFTYLPDSSDSDFCSLRYDASNTYVYGRAYYSPVFRLPYCMTFEPIFRWQLASENLLASEQIGLGGYNSVRGYQERQINVDNAFVMNLDLKSPRIKLFSRFDASRCVDEGLIFLAFFDLGYGYNHKILTGEQDSYTLLSIGPGLRYYFDKWVYMRGDFGFQLHDERFNSRDYMFHFGLVVNY